MAGDFRMVHVYLHPRARSEIVARQPSGVTNAELILEAISARHETVLAHFAAGPPATAATGLFDTSTYQRHKRSRRPVGSVRPEQYGARLHHSHIDTIEQLVSGLPHLSRSAFIAACLELHVLGTINPYSDSDTP